MGVPLKLAVHRNWLGECVDQIRGREPETDGVVWDDDGRSFLVRLALGRFEPHEIAVAIAPDHLVVDAHAQREQPRAGSGELHARADVHLLLPFPDAVDCSRAAAGLRGGVLTIRAPRVGGKSRVRRIPVKC